VGPAQYRWVDSVVVQPALDHDVDVVGIDEVVDEPRHRVARGNRHAPFPGVEIAEELTRVWVRPVVSERADEPGDIAALWFEFDDVRPEIGEQFPGVGCGDVVANL
jgi:hypothetical protein